MESIGLRVQAKNIKKKHGGFPAQKTSNAENVSILWRDHVKQDPEFIGRGNYVCPVEYGRYSLQWCTMGVMAS